MMTVSAAMRSAKAQMNDFVAEIMDAEARFLARRGASESEIFDWLEEREKVYQLWQRQTLAELQLWLERGCQALN